MCEEGMLAFAEELAMPNIDLDGVWKDFSEGKPDCVAKTLRTTNEQALEQVANQLVKESDNLLVGIWRYAFDVVVFAFLVSLVLVFVLVARQSFPHGKSDQVVLTVAAGIPKFHVITDKDVVKKNVKTIDGSLSDVSKVEGHYAMEPIGPGATIRSSQLSSGTVSAAALQGRQVLSLLIKGISYQAKDMPALVSLYVSPRTPDDRQVPKTVVIRGVYILASGGNANSGWAAIALTPEDANTISGLLGTAELYISESAP
jgi:hypothetical protein